VALTINNLKTFWQSI